MRNPESDLLTSVGKPAINALLSANITTLKLVADLTDKELLVLHGVGPKAVRILREQIRNSNPNIEIICTLGAMGQELCPAVEAAVAKFKSATGDMKIHTHFYEVQLESDGIGSDYHPSAKTHKKMSKTLITKIEEVMNW